MARQKDKECPICGDSFSSQGLVGHLQLKHKLEGEELQREYRKVVPPGGDSPALSLDEMGKGSSDSSGRVSSRKYDDPVMQALEEVRLAKKQLRRAKERKEALSESSGGGMSWPRPTTWQKVKGEALDRCKEEIEQFQEKVDRKLEELDDAIRKETERRS
jgi:hypothetical protein